MDKMFVCFFCICVCVWLLPLQILAGVCVPLVLAPTAGIRMQECDLDYEIRVANARGKPSSEPSLACYSLQG